MKYFLDTFQKQWSALSSSTDCLQMTSPHKPTLNLAAAIITLRNFKDSVSLIRITPVQKVTITLSRICVSVLLYVNYFIIQILPYIFRNLCSLFIFCLRYRQWQFLSRLVSSCSVSLLDIFVEENEIQPSQMGSFDLDSGLRRLKNSKIKKVSL